MSISAVLLTLLACYYAYWWLAMPHSLRCSALRETAPGDWMATVHVRPTVLPALLCALLGETEAVYDQAGAPLAPVWRHAINSEVSAFALRNLTAETTLVTVVRECRLVGYSQSCLMPLARTQAAYLQGGDAQCRDDLAFDVLPHTLLLMGGGIVFMCFLLIFVAFIVLGLICACFEKYWPPPPLTGGEV